MRILALTAGSSSFKAAVYELDEAGDDGASPPPGCWESEEVSADGNVEALVSSLQTGVHPLISRERPIDMVGHRIVHGGAELVHSERLTTRVHDAIARVAEMAPMHNTPALAVIGAVTRLLGETVPQVAVFDTAFHATLAPAALTYAGPFEWLAQGIRRYGFHGISHRYASHHAAKMLGRIEQPLRVVSCHLGSGCSLAAVRGGQSVDTTMGFTPLDGVPMARRSGAVDPGILLHLARRGEHTPDSLDRLLNHDAGLAGLSGMATCAWCYRSVTPQTSARGSPSMSTSIASAVQSRPWRRACTGSTRSCSLAASASTLHKSALPYARPSSSSG